MQKSNGDPTNVIANAGAKEEIEPDRLLDEDHFVKEMKEETGDSLVQDDQLIAKTKEENEKLTPV